MKINYKKIINIIGKILIVISIIFIGIKIYKYKIDFSIFNNYKTLLLIIAITVLQGILTFLPPFIYNFILRIFSDVNLPFSTVSNYYLKSNLYKYLPGNVMHYVGRNQLAVDFDIQHKKVIGATITEVILILFSGFIITVSMSHSYFFEWVQKNNINLPILLLIAFLILFILLFIFRKKIKSFISNKKGLFLKKGIKTYLLSILFYCCHFILSGFLFTGLFILICGKVSTGQFFVISGLSVMAWIVGFITPGVPGGIGVREAVMSMFLSRIAPVDSILTTVVLYRIICIIGDILAYLFSIVFKKLSGVVK